MFTDVCRSAGAERLSGCDCVQVPVALCVEAGGVDLQGSAAACALCVYEGMCVCGCQSRWEDTNACGQVGGGL